MNEDGVLINVIHDSSALAFKQFTYQLYTALNILITFLRCFQFFTFSKSLSKFTNILESAKYDIIFFIIMFTFVSFGYACAGYALFGFKLKSYRTLLDSYLSLIRMLKYEYNYKEL